MNKLFYYLLVAGIIFTSCSDDEPEPEPQFIDELVGTYNGVLTEFTCTFPQDIFLEAPGSSATITRETDTEVNVSLVAGGLGEVFNFQGMINSDTSFVIPEFMVDGTTFQGTGILVDQLRIVLGDGCVILDRETATTIFQEQ